MTARHILGNIFLDIFLSSKLYEAITKKNHNIEWVYQNS